MNSDSIFFRASLILAARLIVTFILGVRLLGRAEPSDCQKMGEAVCSARAKLGIDKDVEVRRSRTSGAQARDRRSS